MIEDFLLNVMKPARYTGGEWNMSRVDFEGSSVRFALCFPDLYEIGMSNLGIRILYGVLNGIPGVACERFFSYAADMEALLREKGIGPFSLESRRGLREFDIAGFSLGSELCYSNVLRMLSFAGIPLEAALRTPADPLVIGGGPCVMNPEPVASFFDLFLIGEGEEAVVEIVAVYQRHREAYRSGGIGRQDLLFELSKVEGVYVPSLYAAKYSGPGLCESFSPVREGVPAVVRKRFVRDFNGAFFPLDWLVPYIQVVHDRVSLEVMRGCPNRCRFCQARAQYAPLRLRLPQTAMGQALEAYKRTGYEEVSLCGLSVSDYPALDELIRGLITSFKPKAVAVSLPSIKAKSMLGDSFSLIASIKKTGLTFAPEAGSARLREMLAKDFEEDVFFQALERAYGAGYQHVKLYFMIGLPGETMSDLDGIVDFSTRVSDLRRKISGAPAQVNISVSTFIPKPHTPFQWCAMDLPARIQEKQDYLKKRLRNRRLKVGFHNQPMSFLEAVLSRGDRRLGGVIKKAAELGACFDAWEDRFSSGIWEEAFRQEGIDPLCYLGAVPVDSVPAWDFIDVCVDKDMLRREYRDSVEKG